MKKIINLLGIICLVVITLFIVWFLISYIEVNIHNLSENPQYWNWNIFEVLLN